MDDILRRIPLTPLNPYDQAQKQALCDHAYFSGACIKCAAPAPLVFSKEWRRVEDGFPQETLVLVCIVDDGQPYQTVAIWMNGTWENNYTLKAIEHGRVSHWMHLPPLPFLEGTT